ncbi:MAG TPA: phosphoribosylaminoimidazolesuccinocarboxamide synthase [Elusimicrobiota bacterium]|nr:phosphoribosylaminoimidazolesuccinocarboxamide synthase [Elusimicrobiota bacterium]
MTFPTPELPFKLWTRGKVRDVYDLGENLLIVATDRISAYDSILPTLVPQKGVLLCRLSNFWFQRMGTVCANHLVSTDIGRFPPEAAAYRPALEGRTVLVKKARRIDVECVVRGYLAGSAWKEYQEKRTVAGIPLPPGLKESDRFPEPLFTPAIKAPQGAHDENIDYERLCALVGTERAGRLKDLSLKIFKEASATSESRGFILADTKFEFGEIDGGIILIDELLTPDSSRYWDRSSYRPGRPQESFDKQYVRDHLDRIGWDRRPPAPALPPDVVRKTREKYVSAYETLTGEKFS